MLPGKAERAETDARGEENRLGALRQKAEFLKALDDTVREPTEESGARLAEWMYHPYYGPLIQMVMIYAGITQVKNDPEDIRKAGEGLLARCRPDDATSFNEAEVNYYVYYLECLKACYERFGKGPGGGRICAEILEWCRNIRQSLALCQGDQYIGDAVEEVFRCSAEVEQYIISRENEAG